jgi:uncharacterized protein (DUF427 family)
MAASEGKNSSGKRESVWDYPRPPRLEKCDKELEVIFNGISIAKSRKAFRVLETSHPPVYYFPPEDVVKEYLRSSNKLSYCEWKGPANFYSVKVNGKLVENAAWFYPNPTERFEPLANYIAFYPGLMDECLVNGEKARPQPGNFYGGWITDDLIGPFKGAPGTLFW